MQTILKNNEISFTTDLWTDEYTQRSFLTLSSHLLNDSMELKKYVLGTREFVEKKTGNNIQKFTLEILKEYIETEADGEMIDQTQTQTITAEDKLSKGVIVTDNGSNVVLAFRPYTRLSCACHNLNLVMYDVLESNDTLPELKAVISASKKLVAYFKHSELNNKLSKSLKQHVTTRWNSIYTMLNSIQVVYGEIQNLLIARDEIFRLGGLNLTTLKSLTDFLNLFRECSENLSSDLYPTLNRYVLWEQKLIKHCKLQPEDSDLVKELKKQTAAALQKRFQPQDLHYIALFLDPNFKSLKFLSDDKQMSVKSSIKVMLQSILDEEAKDMEVRPIGTIPTKRKKLDEAYTSTSTLFDEFQDSSGEEEADKIDSEIESYLRKKIAPNTCLLEFWKTCNDLRLLKKLARRILNVPASSATSERLFSTSGRILEERRTRLLSDNLDKLLFLHTNADL